MAVEVKVQTLLPHGSRTEDKRPKRRIEGQPDIVSPHRTRALVRLACAKPGGESRSHASIRQLQLVSVSGNLVDAHLRGPKLHSGRDGPTDVRGSLLPGLERCA